MGNRVLLEVVCVVIVDGGAAWLICQGFDTFKTSNGWQWGVQTDVRNIVRDSGASRVALYSV